MSTSFRMLPWMIFPLKMKGGRFWWSAKLYIPSTINIWPFGPIENGLVLGRLASESSKISNLKLCSNLYFNPEFSIQFRTYFRPKRERNNPWLKTWFNILLQSQLIVDARGKGQCLEYLLGIYNSDDQVRKPPCKMSMPSQKATQKYATFTFHNTKEHSALL
jgi:hypothetical protein